MKSALLLHKYYTRYTVQKNVSRPFERVTMCWACVCALGIDFGSLQITREYYDSHSYTHKWTQQASLMGWCNVKLAFSKYLWISDKSHSIGWIIPYILRCYLSGIQAFNRIPFMWSLVNRNMHFDRSWFHISSQTYQTITSPYLSLYRIEIVSKWNHWAQPTTSDDCEERIWIELIYVEISISFVAAFFLLFNWCTQHLGCDSSITCTHTHSHRNGPTDQPTTEEKINIWWRRRSRCGEHSHTHTHSRFNKLQTNQRNKRMERIKWKKRRRENTKKMNNPLVWCSM